MVDQDYITSSKVATEQFDAAAIGLNFGELFRW